MSKPHLIRAGERGTCPTYPFQHPLNPRSEVVMQSLSDATGLERLGVHVMRVPPGKESFIYHAHYTEEEFVLILSGRGIAEIGDDEVEVGPGDFMGFPTPSVGHHLRNPFAEDLVYLSGGERHASEIADFPKVGKRLVRVGMALAVSSIDEATGYPGFPMLSVEGAKAKLGG
jgi:uncharacterized cupin superfamily protein